MFEIDTGQTYVPARPEEVLDIYNSINSSSIATPNRTPEATQAYIGSIYRSGLYHIFIFLHLTASNEGLLYKWSDGGVPGDKVNNIYQKAFEFTESMGFMMDNMHYREKNLPEKTALHAQVPMFHASLSAFGGAAEEEKVEELVIESLEGEDQEIQLEAVEDSEEDINLDVLKEEEPEAEAAEEEVQEITLGGQAMAAAPEPALVEAVEEDVALDALEVSEPTPAAAEEEQLLDSLEAPAEPEPALAEPEPEPVLAEAAPEPAEPEPALAEPEAQPADEEEMAIDNILGEETLEGETVAEPVMDSAPSEEPMVEEVSLTPEEAQVLGGLETAAPAESAIEEEEITMAPAPAPAPEPPPPPAPPRAAAPPPPPAPVPPPPPMAAPVEEETQELEGMAEPEPAPRPSAPVSFEGGVTEEEYLILARFLAMM